jgi:hypothetical protein
MPLNDAQWAAALSSVARPKSGQRGWAAKLPRSAVNCQGAVDALSAWELACHVSLTGASQVSYHLRLSVSDRRAPVLIPLSGTQRARCRRTARPRVSHKSCVGRLDTSHSVNQSQARPSVLPYTTPRRLINCNIKCSGGRMHRNVPTYSCDNCGNDIATEMLDFKESFETAKRISINSPSDPCPKCGAVSCDACAKRIPSNAKFCMYCGSSPICMNCGGKLPGKAAYCPKCGEARQRGGTSS